jgi:hypothetical protein
VTVARPGQPRRRLSLGSSDAWRPLAQPVFLALWLAVLVTNIGNWMETVGAQWLIVSQPNSELLVAVVQTADTIPVMLLALPAGVLADVFDRRLLLLVTQIVVAAIALTTTWFLYRDGADPSRFLETFEVPTWDVHLRQHGGRLTGFDAELERDAMALATSVSETYHYFPADEEFEADSPSEPAPTLGP